jgi:DNA polymerase-3 subunit alpha
MVMGKNFVHLHVHTEFSMLDGKGTVESYVARAKELGMPALSMTDHGNVMGAPEFYWACKREGIEPILGEEFYFVPDVESARDVKKPGEKNRFHVTILAKGAEGFRVLQDLSTASHERYYYKPLIDRPLLESLGDDRKHLVVLSGCAGSIISQSLLGGTEVNPDAEVEWWMRMFPNFYIELMSHGTDFDRELNTGLVKLAKRKQLEWVVTNDPHYVLEEECHDHDALLAIQTASDIDDPERFRFHGEGYHLRSRQEMFRAFRDYGKSIWTPGATNTLKVAELCKTEIPAFDARSWHIPEYPDARRGAYDTLRTLVRRGLRQKGLMDKPEYIEQAKHELREIKKVGMSDFLLITWDVLEEARRRGIRVGPGRGSVAGTLVGYLTGIHKVDPIKHDLLFERFLNPERPKMPDIDSDFAPSRREEMFDYVRTKYGKGNVQHVAAYQTLKNKGMFRSLARAHGLNPQQVEMYAKKIMEDDEGGAILPEEIVEGYPDLVEQLERLSGLKSSISSHPAGVLIFSDDDPIKDLVPMMWVPSSKKMVSQYALKACEGLGLMKSDLLGLRTLETIDECLKLIKERHDVDIDPDDWVPDEEDDDADVYKMLAEGHVEGVFQMEGSTNAMGIQQIQPDKFEDIVTCTSLYRKGPIMAGADKRFLKNKRDQKVRVIHPSMEEILSDSWGELIYQEQMFRILNELAGFSWSRVDDAKTAMARKDPEKMAGLKDEAVEGFQKVAGMTELQAGKVWEMIAAQAAYLFNRSHAVAYSILTYQTARLKHLYPLEYIAALIRTVDPKSKEARQKRQRYLGEAFKMGFRILPPDVNKSGPVMTVSGKRTLRFGLQDVKGVGAKAAEKIAARPHGPYKSMSGVEVVAGNVGMVEKLAAVGAFEGMGIKADPTIQEELLEWQFEDSLADVRNKYESKVVLPNGDGSQVVIIGELRENNKKTTKTGKEFHTWKVRWDAANTFTFNVWSSAEELFDIKAGSIVMVKGKWSEQWRNIGVSDSDQVKVIRRKMENAA